MAFVNSSVIGVDFNNPSSTALFGLGSEVLGSQASEWTYCIATGTLVTGQIVTIMTAGTAYACTTALIAGADVLGTTGQLNLGAIQTLATQGQYAWVARKGVGLYVATTGTVPPTYVGMAANAGFLQTALAVAVGNTMAGIFITTSASTATAATAFATLIFPRAIAAVPSA
jgi:hypothetical protein